LNSIDRMSTRRATALLSVLRSKGVELWIENGALRYRAPKGALVAHDLDALKSSSGHLRALLEAGIERRAISEIVATPRLATAPLTFSQLAHWKAYQDERRAPIRQIASATRMRGELNVSILEQSIQSAIMRHDALRTRVIGSAPEPQQQVRETLRAELRREDLASLARERHDDVLAQLIERLIMEPIDLASDNLLASCLVRLGPSEHVLILAIEHIVSDAHSLGLLLRDIMDSYAAAIMGTALAPTSPIVQFPQYALWQRGAVAPLLERRGREWIERSAIRAPVRFPEDSPPGQPEAPGWDAITFHVDRHLKDEFDRWCRRHRATIVVAALTAYAALVCRWCDTEECLIQYPVDGRVSPDLRDTIGFFASVLYVAVHVHKSDRWIDLLEQVAESLGQAHERADYAHSRSRSPRPDFTRSTAFNWIPSPHESETQCLGVKSGMDLVQIRFEHPMLSVLESDDEPSILLREIDGALVGSVAFCRRRHSAATMQRFVESYKQALQTMLHNPQRRLDDLALA
jgi:hypothetical protein